METRTVEVGTPDGPMPVYEAIGDGARRAVVVVQEAFGVNDYIEDVARRFAAEGYHAVAPHFFHRTGGGTIDYDTPNMMEAIGKAWGALDDGKILDDLDGALGRLREAGWRDEQIGVVGFCWGGRVAFLAAVRRSLGAAVTYYGGGIVTGRFDAMPALVGEAPSLQAPWLGLFGENDRGIPVADVELLAKEVAEAPVATEVKIYPGADHGFFCDQRASYHAEASADAWPRTLAWLTTHLRP